MDVLYVCISVPLSCGYSLCVFVQLVNFSPLALLYICILLCVEVNISVTFVNFADSLKNFLYSFEEFLNQRLGV